MSRRQKPGMRQLETFVVVFVGAVVVAVIWAVWRSTASSGVAGAALSTLPAPSGAPAGEQSNTAFVGAPAPDFSLALFDTGETVTLSGLKGQPVILDFFASWCPSCRAEAPGLQRFWEAYQDTGLTLLAVALNDSADGLRVFKAAFGTTYPMGLDETGEVAAMYRVGSIPTFVLIDREGRIANVIVGAMSDDAMAAEAEALLK
ncbi:MAG: peroxiredoxin family protein [Anaerolineales bacterium]